jgi:D-cysteine desulfhydrase
MPLDRDPRLSRRLFTGAMLGVLAGCSRLSRSRSPSSIPVLARRAPSPILEAPPSSEKALISPPISEVRAEATLPLFEAYPRLGQVIPRAPLGLFPTPVDHASALGAQLGIGALFVKRDDVSGVLYGGGKTRKLELFLGEAQRGGYPSVITFGSVGSHHAVATAVYAKALQMKAILMLLPEPTDEAVRASLRAEVALGATILPSPGARTAERAARRALLASGDAREPYVIPVGGSSPLGNVAFVNAAFELKRDVELGRLPEPDVVYLAMGTMGNAVGLALGFAALKMKTRVVAVRASSPGTSSARGLRAMLVETRDFLRTIDPSFPEVDADRCAITIAGGQLGAGYARPTKSGLAAIDVARCRAGLALEPTYTGKALAALIADAPTLANDVVLFWNTQSSRTLEITEGARDAIPAAFQGYFASSKR